MPSSNSSVFNAYPGASAALRGAIQCLRDKKYPADIEKCGLAGFATKTKLYEAETCLADKMKNASSHVVVDEYGKIIGRIPVVFKCDESRTLVVFFRNSRPFVVDEIGFLAYMRIMD